ncbi:asparagine synthase (glutamine-hydrolyzing) [Gimesia panareensis]|uniref:asparagine synthase (glutamine-hydrolyzing) n=1 Tax=Gimesia panareensis TaxID=2527978 RepID=UPI0011894F61|nr:asparagine synthase (glutamine-hydrolyzing) [Gimesia panareensis]QDU50419.1 Asparagine synthetase [glutamine-hydrolyzing] 1 [Gimesia panareensis]
MCGITGTSWTTREKNISPLVLRSMTSVLSHRGPDDAGGYHSDLTRKSFLFDDESHLTDFTPSSETGAALGHRRLSIIDLGTGHQPLCNEDGTIWIAFNGEIYNYQELRNELVQQGHQFKTESDTEVIVHLYEEQGPACVERLRGMFAFGIWDEHRQRLLLARDRIGQKPLFYREEPGRLSFASELKSLLQLPNASREVDPHAIDLFLAYQYVPHPWSILKGYHKLPPAHRAIYEQGHLTVERYWTPPYQDPQSRTDLQFKSPQEWSQALRHTLTESVRIRMRSDVPLGAFLSGGIDSTIIAGLMQSMSERPVHTFSIGFPVKQFDERSYAREAAKMLGTEHHEYVVEPEALEMLPRLAWHYDEPFADSSAIPTMYLSQVTRQEVTVSLSGDGGDELFAGYDRYRAVALSQWFDRLPGFIKKTMTASIWQKLPASVEQKSFRRRVKRFLAGLAIPPERRYLKWVGIFDTERRLEMYTPDFREQLQSFDADQFLLDAYQLCPDRDFVTRTTATDVLTYLPCDILTKVDIASMAHSLECRSPFLDHHVAELAAVMPLDLKMHKGRGKQILVDTFADLLPESIQTRKKMGFGVPLNHWFRNELKPLLHDVLLDQRAIDRQIFNRAAVEQLISEHQNQQWDHSARLWSLLVLEMWFRTFIDPVSIPDHFPEAALV